MKTKVMAALAVLALSLPAHAGNTNAQSMAAALKSGGGGNGSALKDALGLTGQGGVARFVSGGGTGGWGNEGSKLTGGQVSSKGKIKR